MPAEIHFLEAFDAFSERVQQIVDMPTDTVELLRAFLAQNGGRLSKRARTEEFAALSTEEVEAVEQAFALTFGAGATA
jgi:hypothetical protein